MDPLLLALIGGGVLFLIIVVVGIAITASSERSLVEERLGKYLEDDAELAAQQKKEQGKATPLGDMLNNWMAGSKAGSGISRELARADIKLKPAEYVATRFIVGIGGVALGWFFGGKTIPPSLMNMVFMGVGFIVGWQIPKMYVGSQQKKRLQRFNDQLGDMLNLMVNGLRAGYSTLQALESVSKEMPPPISDEFRRVVQEMQLGLNMEAALDNLLRRIPSEDLDLVITAMNVQREVGGNLAEILDTISYTIRERVRIKGEIRVLTSQVLYSGKFLAMMPLMIMGVLWVMNRSYMMEFFNPKTRIPGIIALSVAGLLIIMGYFVMTKIADIEV